MKKKKHDMGGKLGNEPPQGNTLKAKNAKAMVNIPNVLKGRYAYVPESYHNMLDMIIIKNLEDKVYGSFQHTTFSKSADKIYEKEMGGMLDSSSKDYINKKWKYAEGGALDAVLPAVPALLGAINPALGAVAGVGVSMYKQSQAQREMDAQQGQRMVNTNPYGYASGGALQTASPGSRGRRKKFNAFPALLTAAAAGLGAAALYRQNNMAAQQGMQERLNQQPMPAQLMAPAQPVQPAYSEAFSPVSNQMMDTMGTGLPSYATYAEKGGMLTGREGATMFVGDKHSAPSGGIAVTPNGVPMPASNQLVEGGEVSYKLRDGRTYIFSEKLKI